MISQDVNKHFHPKQIDRLHTKFLYCDLALTCQLELRFGTYGTFGGPSDENPWLLTTLKAKNRVIPFQPRPFSPMPPGKSTAACAGRWMGVCFDSLCSFWSVPIPMCQHLPSLQSHSLLLVTCNYDQKGHFQFSFSVNT